MRRPLLHGIAPLLLIPQPCHPLIHPRDQSPQRIDLALLIQHHLVQRLHVPLNVHHQVFQLDHTRGQIVMFGHRL